MLKNIFTAKKLATGAFQVLVFIGVFYLASQWQQRNMLDTNVQSIVPTLALPNINGTTQTTNFHDVKKPQQKTLVYFFAPWCTVCHYSVDALESIKQSTPQEDLNIVMVALSWKNIEEVKTFLDEHKITVPVLLGTNQTASDYKINGFPSYYLISNKGEIIAKDMGFTTQAGIKLRLLASKI